MKGRIIEDDEMLGVEARAQPCLQPGVEDRHIAGALEEQRFFDSSVHTGGKQRGPPAITSWLAGMRSSRSLRTVDVCLRISPSRILKIQKEWRPKEV